MSLSRRNFIRILGSTAVIAAASSTVAGCSSEKLENATLPWQTAKDEQSSDTRVKALSYAILAPNPHNRQPWVVELAGKDELTLYCDLDRRLPATDPLNRQITIGLGCFLEVLRIAALEDGYEVEISAFPAGFDNEELDGRPVAKVKFIQNDQLEKDSLFNQILHRRTNKEPFDLDKGVQQNTLTKLTAGMATSTVAVSSTAKIEDVEILRDLAWRAHKMESYTPEAMQESIDLMRFGQAEINANPDGIDLGGAFLSGLNMVGVLTRETLADTSSYAFDTGMEMYRETIGSSQAFLWISTNGNSRLDQIETGQQYVRLHLKATELGLEYHPLSQSLQEYPEMDDLFNELHKTVQADGSRVQMLVRLGYCKKAEPSPRWPLETRIRNKNV